MLETIGPIDQARWVVGQLEADNEGEGTTR